MVGEFSESPVNMGFLDEQPNPQCTHRFAVFRVWRNGGSTPIGIWDVNLKNINSSSAFGEMASRRSIAGVALSALSIIHSKKIIGFDWQSRMERLNWLQMLETRAKKELVNPHHSLQAVAIYLEAHDE